MRVVAVQLPPCTGAAEADRATALEAVRGAAASGAQLVVLPELALTPYFCADPPGAWRARAEPVPGPVTAEFGRLCRQLEVALVLPLHEHDPVGGTWHNSAVVIDASGSPVAAVDRAGRRGLTTRKLHLPVGSDPPPGFDEPAHFTPGELLGVHEVAGVRLGVLVCYDRRFPECWRELRAAGAELVAVVIAGSGGDDEAFVLGELRTHARENGLVAVAASKVGAELVGGHEVANAGATAVLGPDGAVLAHRPRAAGPGVVAADVDLAALPSVRARLPYFHHRRTDLFGGPPDETRSPRALDPLP